MMNRRAKRDVVVIDGEEATREQPAEKTVKVESEPVPDVAQLQQQLAKSDEKFKRACEMAGGYKARVEFLENIIDNKEGIIANANREESTDELRKKVAELTKKLEEREARESFDQQQQHAIANQPQKIADLGYCFRDGKLRTIEGDQPFTFTTPEAYAQLGTLIDEVVYEKMEEAGLQKKYINVGPYRRFLFVSPGYETKKRILLIMNGSGEAKAGQWNQGRIINDSLDNGSQLPYIRRALANDWGVVVLNHNEKCEGQDYGCHPLEGHGLCEWAEVFNEASNDAEVVVVAHSSGGAIISEVCRKMDRANDKRLKTVALISSWFSVGPGVLAANWGPSKLKKLHETCGVYKLYSGDDTYEGSPAAAINSVFRMLEGVNVETKEEEFRKLMKECERIALADSAERARKACEKSGE